jgi:hypothetical protein
VRLSNIALRGVYGVLKGRTRQKEKKRLVVGRDKMLGKNDQLAFTKIAEVAHLNLRHT